ncbi:hypothetical protein AJ80_04783 [Polytolypa hystricis UAMH7299]|uniref:DUF6536 domain-containing protein n=1 Tax=Polytolypa hystricis (strain UAMH7299) TaxID=1447883 RepID=A0A2B7Y8Q3_POLH7|nr:hypothetical protein AJ80_04783 [Polytolypa hystricis UAMH7299]
MISQDSRYSSVRASTESASPSKTPPPSVQAPENSDQELYKKKSFQQRWFGSLKSSLISFAFGAAVVLSVNIAWLVTAQKRYGIVDGIGTIQRGDCAASKGLNRWLHLLINTLSTLLLSGSFAFAQAFNSPTRAEIDAAHARHRWLHTGVMSFRNFRHISTRKSVVCVVLLITSAPFHLLYNSVVFTTLSAHNYDWAVVTEDFLRGAPFNATFSKYIDEYAQRQVVKYTKLQEKVKDYERIGSHECIRAYASAFQGTRGHVALVSSERRSNTSILAFDSALAGYEGTNSWLCSEASKSCNTDSILASPGPWKVHGYPIDYCLSQAVPERCSVQFSFEIMKALIAFNVLKLIAMLFILYRFKAEDLIASVGDAASSFLLRADVTTYNMGLASKRKLYTFWLQERLPRTYSSDVQRWHLAVSRLRWAAFALIMTICYLLSCIGLGAGIFYLKERVPSVSISSLWSMGFGSVNADTLVYVGESSLVTTAITANLPQLAMAMLYFVNNGIIASMFIAADWSCFAFKSQTLMVTSPAGKQRGTWFFGAPMTYGVPLLTIHTLLHWLVSQSLFIVQAEVYDDDKPPTRRSNCGYSPIAMIFTLIAGSLIILSAVVLGFRKFKPGSPPVVSTCSAAISATCHLLTPRDEKVVYQELRWGEIGPVSLPITYCSLAPAAFWNDEPGIYARIPRGDKLYL